MKKLIDNFISTTGWTSNGTISVSENEVVNYIEGYNTKSLLFQVPEGNINKYTTKTVSIDITGYSEIVFWFASLKKESTEYLKESDYAYKIEFDGSNAFYIPAKTKLTNVRLYVSGLTNLDRIRVTALHNDADYFVMSYMQAIEDELPIDLWNGIINKIEVLRDARFGNGIDIGLITGTAGDTTITLSSLTRSIEKENVLYFSDGANSEYHQIEQVGENTYKLNGNYAGKALVNTFVAATVYLFYPVEIGNLETEIRLPSITVWGLVAEEFLNESKEEIRIDTHRDDGAIFLLQRGILQKHNILIDCEARNVEDLAKMSTLLKQMVGQETFFCNGRKCMIEAAGIPTEIMPTQAFDIIPKIQYPNKVEIMEDIWTRNQVTKVITTNLDVNLTEKGSIP